MKVSLLMILYLYSFSWSRY